MARHTVVIVEDDDDILDYLATTVGECAELALVATATTLTAARAALIEHRPDVVLVDLGLPDGSGIDLIAESDEHAPGAQCLVITGFNDERHVFAALEAGAKGYLYKHDDEQEIVRAVLQLVAGGAPISPVIARMLLTRFERPAPVRGTEPGESLTEREMTVLNLVSRGFTAREIAAQLDIAYYTVTTHVKNIYRKLEVNSRAEAIFEANHLGLLGGGLRGDGGH